MEEVKFFVCKHCGNLVGMIRNSGVPMVCCGEKMTELMPNTVEASAEKHVPVVKQEGDTVTVEIGSAAHPMLDEHYIEWIYLRTEKGAHRIQLHPAQEPKACFRLCEGDKAIAAYAYCNLHGLWKK